MCKIISCIVLCYAVSKHMTFIFVYRPTWLWVAACFFLRIVSSGVAMHGVIWSMDHDNILVGQDKTIQGGLKNLFILIQSTLTESIALALRGRCCSSLN